jgi:NAD(P)-dependent dehydrogenase (short-subunit alcohol dehydrogenase family)
MARILITGSSSGIGLGAAVELARQGHEVFASMRDPARSATLETALSAAGATAAVIQLDVTDAGSVQRGVATVIEQAGGIDVLLNNAGITSVGPLENVSDEEMLSVFQTNVFGAHRMARAVLPSMRAARHGRIVNVSSVAAHPRFGIRLWGAYAMSKAALSCMAAELLKDVGPLGIEVVLLEAGVAGQTAAWALPKRVAEDVGPEGSGYEVVGRIGVAQIAAASGGLDRLPATAAMVAAACTVPDVPFRYPPEIQAGLDQVDALADERFRRLASCDNDPALFENAGGFWALQQALLAANEP